MLSRAIINALLPEGAFWEPQQGSDYDKLLDGIGANWDLVTADMTAIGNIRNPYLTPILSDLEAEYGVIPSAGATDAQRRQRLAATMYNNNSTGAWDFLQSALRAAGFAGVYVYPNDPQVNPATFITKSFSLECGTLWALPTSGNKGQCGEPYAQCASVGGEVCVNGDLYTPMENYLNQCGASVSTSPQCGNSVLAGDFNGYNSAASPLVYQIPSDSGYWGLFFFVGGAATYNGSGQIISINSYIVPEQRRDEFRRIILKIKPMFAWGALVVTYQ